VIARKTQKIIVSYEILEKFTQKLIDHLLIPFTYHKRLDNEQNE